MNQIVKIIILIFLIYSCLKTYNQVSKPALDHDNIAIVKEKAKKVVSVKSLASPSPSISPTSTVKEEELDGRYAFKSIDLRFNGSDLEVIRYQKNSVLTKKVVSVFWKEHIHEGDDQALFELQDIINEVIVKKYQGDKEKIPFTLSKLTEYQDEAFGEGLKLFNDKKRLEEGEQSKPADEVDVQGNEQATESINAPPVVQQEATPVTCQGDNCVSLDNVAPPPQGASEAPQIQDSTPTPPIQPMEPMVTTVPDVTQADSIQPNPAPSLNAN
jgi:hypothetical protein